jgi:hypothetical protein
MYMEKEEAKNLSEKSLKIAETKSLSRQNTATVKPGKENGLKIFPPNGWYSLLREA